MAYFQETCRDSLKRFLTICLVVSLGAACSMTLAELRAPYSGYPTYREFARDVPLPAGHGRMVIYKLAGGTATQVFVDGVEVGKLPLFCTFSYFDGPEGTYTVGLKYALSPIFEREVKMRPGEIRYLENIRSYDLITVASEMGGKDVAGCNYWKPDIP